MIHKVGLLPACNHQQIPFAYKMYTKADETGWKQSNAFKKTFSIDVEIHFVGVWLVLNPNFPPPPGPPLLKKKKKHHCFISSSRDTVNSVGLIPRRLPFTTSNTVVNTFRHALSLDEHRAKFKANTWNRPSKEEELLSITDQKLHQTQSGGSITKHHRDSLKILEWRFAKDRTGKPTDVEEVGTIHTLPSPPLRRDW